ncbi:MAG: ATP-grasp domain-containing protein, partial [Candidatus Helarchaeota archaeon]
MIVIGIASINYNGIIDVENPYSQIKIKGSYRLINYSGPYQDYLRRMMGTYVYLVPTGIGSENKTFVDMDLIDLKLGVEDKGIKSDNLVSQESEDSIYEIHFKMNDPLKNLVNQILNYCIESSPDKMVCFFSEHRASSLLNYLYSLRKRYKRVDSIEEFWKLHDTEYLKNNVIYLIGESFPKTHWIIGAKKSYEISRLKEEYKKRGLKVMHYNWNELKFPLEQVPLTCLIRYSKKMMEKLSIVYILSALEEFARAGTIIIPPLDCIYQEDKMSMYLLWKKYLHQDVKMPDTIITKNLDEAFEFLEKKGMVVFKPIIGGLGKDVIKIDSIDHLQEIYERYQILYLQEYIESPGYDIRVIVIDGKIVAKYVRYNPKDFRHNIHMGGVG